MNGVISIVHSIVSGNSRPSSGSFQKEASAGFGTILAEIQGKEMLPALDSTRHNTPLNVDEDVLPMLSEMTLNTIRNMEGPESAQQANGESIQDFIYGLIEQLQVDLAQDRGLLEDMILQIQQFIQNPHSIDSANLLDHAQLQQLTDVEQLTDNMETRPAFAAMYVLLKGLAQVVPNTQEQLKQFKQEINGQPMPSLAQVGELMKKLEVRLQSMNSRNSFNQTNGTNKFLGHTYPLTGITNGGKFSSQQLMNGPMPFNNGVMQTSLMDNQLTKPMQSVNLAGNADLITSSETDHVVAALPMSKVEQFVLHIGQINGKTDSAKLYQEFQQILAKSTFAQNVNNSRLTIRLAPEHLGSLKIELIKQDQVMIAKMITSTQQAKELLESQLSSLKQALINAHIQVEKIDIQQQFQPLERFLTQPDQQQGQSQQHSKSNEQKEDKEENEESKSFLSSLEEELLNINV